MRVSYSIVNAEAGELDDRIGQDRIEITAAVKIALVLNMKKSNKNV